MPFEPILLLFLVGVVVAFLTIVAFMRRYKRCPSDRLDPRSVDGNMVGNSR